LAAPNILESGVRRVPKMEGCTELEKIDAVSAAFVSF
jgi:hypothetical protein